MPDEPCESYPLQYAEFLTVSYYGHNYIALVNDKNIHPETKQKVLEMAEKMGYKPNPTALNLKYGQSKSIGFVVPEMTTPFFCERVERHPKYFVSLRHIGNIIMQSDENPEIERKTVDAGRV
ncbi:hypothetical protein FQR65_LT17743 [Abscondita terminalis]|nr:hypothetical protein FQR65_LT17743 [Abscondita terminalis]